MKKLLFLLLICTSFTAASAADPAFYGNFLSALEEKNPQERARKIVYALEKSSCCDRDALEMLAVIINENGSRHDLFFRVLALWEKHPADQNVSKFCINYAFNNQYYPEQYINALEKSLKYIDFNNLPDEEKTVSAFQSLHHFNTILVEKNNPERPAALLDDLRKKFPLNDSVLQIAVENAAAGLFLRRTMLPEMMEFQQLPDNDIWKARITQISSALLKVKVSDRYDAASLISNAGKLYLPEVPELLKKYVKIYPEHYWLIVSAEIAKKYKQHNLFVPVRNNNFANFIYYLHVRNFPAARRTIKKLPNRPDWLIIFNSARDRHQEVIQTILEKPEILNNVMPVTLTYIANSIQMSKNKTALELLIKTLKNNPHLLEYPELCNSAAYLAADFNIMLDDALRLSALAVKKSPTESAFLDTFAWTLFRRGKFAEAERFITEAVKFIPFQRNSCVIYLHAARIKFALNKNIEAAEFLKKAKKLYSPESRECSEYDPALQKEMENFLK